MGTQPQTPKGRRESFRLIHGSLTVGTLTVENGLWTFKYSEDFRKRQDLRPIVQFPDTSRTYNSEELWPFFGMRIPSISQPAVRNAVRQEGIDANDKVQMLRRFGRRTISTPFELVGTPDSQDHTPRKSKVSAE
jgi:HipA-like protein